MNKEIKETQFQINQIKGLIEIYKKGKSWVQFELIKDLMYYQAKLKILTKNETRR